MGSSAEGRYQGWLEYEKDTNAKVLKSIESVPIERREEKSYLKAVTLFAHMMNARKVWLSRIVGQPLLNVKLFPEEMPLEEVASEWEATQQKWTHYVATLTTAELDRCFEYRSSDGGHFRSRIEDILDHLFAHSFYHRGQIAMLVREAGGQPASTDYVYWTRESLTAPPQ
jgi:uncharacterized damage-inducible protein DinB